MQRITKVIYFFIVVFLTGCGLGETNSQEGNRVVLSATEIKEKVVSEFNNEGIMLIEETDENNNLFSLTKSEEYHYSFEEGAVIIICCYKDKNQQRQEINDSLATIDFGAKYLIAYIDNYAIFYISPNENLTQNAKNAFNNLRK